MKKTVEKEPIQYLPLSGTRSKCRFKHSNNVFEVQILRKDLQSCTCEILSGDFRFYEKGDIIRLKHTEVEYLKPEGD